MSGELPLRHPLHIVGARTAAGQNVEVSIEGDRIAAFGHPTVPPPADGTRLDASGLIVAPGYIDLQINGGHGLDLWSEPESLWPLARLLPRHGVTSFCPTIISGPPGRAEAAIEALSRRPADHLGAEPLGLHLEGPMLNPARRGAHAEQHLAQPGPGVIDGWTASRGVALVTLAPELAGASEVIQALRATGVVVSAGHSDATADEAARAADTGVTMTTHLFNAMAPLHHRRPGLAGYTLTSGRLVAGMIVDGIHIDPAMVALAWRSLGPAGVVLVSDAVAAMGLPPGTHRFGSRTIAASPETGVRDADGTLTGSNQPLDAAVRNLVAFTGCSAAQAIACASQTPAQVIGRSGDRGVLRPGTRADVVLLDGDLEVVATICGGRLAHLGPDADERLSRP